MGTFPKSMNEKIYQLIKRRILTLEYAPGQKLEIQKIKEETGIGLSPIKAAIGRLNGEGFLKIVSRSGTYVTEITVDEIKTLMDYRMILERGAVPFVVARITKKEITKLYSIHKKLVALEPNGYWNYMVLDNQFHRVIIKSAKNRKLSDAYDLLSPHFNMIRFHNFLHRGKGRDRDEEHTRIIKAIECKDDRRVDEAVIAHLQGTKKEFCGSYFGKSLSPIGKMLKV